MSKPRPQHDRFRAAVEYLRRSGGLEWNVECVREVFEAILVCPQGSPDHAHFVVCPACNQDTALDRERILRASHRVDGTDAGRAWNPVEE